MTPTPTGLPNLIECALGTEPLDATSVAAPISGAIEEAGRSSTTLEVRRRIDSAALRYEVLESADLVRRSPVADVLELSRDPVPGQPGLESVRLAIWPALVSRESGFLSVRVSESPDLRKAR